MLSEEPWVHPCPGTQGGRVGLFLDALDKSVQPLELGQPGPAGVSLSLAAGAGPKRFL